MILISQNQGGALRFLAVLWYYLSESIEEEKIIIICYLPPFYPENELFLPFFRHFCQAQTILRFTHTIY